MSNPQIIAGLAFLFLIGIVFFIVWGMKSLAKSHSNLTAQVSEYWKQAKTADTKEEIQRIYVEAEKYCKKHAFRPEHYTLFYELFGYLSGKYEKWI